MKINHYIKSGLMGAAFDLMGVVGLEGIHLIFPQFIPNVDWASVPEGMLFWAAVWMAGDYVKNRRAMKRLTKRMEERWAAPPRMTYPIETKP